MMRYYRQGDALRNWERLEDSLNCYEKALSIKPSDYWSWYQLGKVLQQLHRYQEAIECYNHALDAEPEAALTWYNRACCQALLGKKAAAIANLQRAIDLNPRRYQDSVATNPDFANLHQDERYQALIHLR
jgi:tetratricopeptide (TPR) repeat protein